MVEEKLPFSDEDRGDPLTGNSFLIHEQNEIKKFCKKLSKN